MDVRCLRLPALVLLALCCFGCAKLTTVMRQVDLTDETNPRSIAIDAKQRVVLSGRTAAVTNGTTTYSRPVVCAEPSPDALSALATSGGFSLSNADREYASNFALSEAAGSIGLRTQSIQLMRDAMYRLCEGYLSGALNEVAFETLHRRFQSSMVAILAIEQLTGAVRAPTVALSGSALVGSAELVAKYTTLTEQTRQALLTAQKSVDEATANFNAAKAAREGLEKQTTPAPATKEAIDSAKKTEGERQATLTTATTALTNLQTQLSYYDAARIAALAGSGNAATSAVVNMPADIARSEAAMREIAGAVQQVVTQTLELNFSRELCTSILARAATTTVDPLQKTAVASCYNYLDSSVNLMTGLSKRLEASNTRLAAATTEAQRTAELQELEAISDALQASPEGGGRIFVPMQRQE